MSDWRRVQDAAEAVGALMDEIKTHFKPECRITVVVRAPGHDDRDFVLTDDDLREAAAAIERRRTSPTTKQNAEVAALAACLAWDANDPDEPRCRRPAITGRAPGETSDPQPGD